MTRRFRIALFIALAILPLTFSVAFADTLGQRVIFNVNDDFDRLGRTTMTATLQHIGDHAYYYVDDTYWNSLDSLTRQNFLNEIVELSEEFDNQIYPTETAVWGSEPNPGVDNDSRVTVLVEWLRPSHGGYFSTANGYSKQQVPDSNAREMIVVSSESVRHNFVRSFLAHEFQHLISFNQKELLRQVSEDVWLNEVRSEHSITLVGYNDEYQGSNIQSRAASFFSNPSDSLVEWPNVGKDYAGAAMFGEYFAEEYGIGLLAQSLRSNLKGIASLEKVLADNRTGDSFLRVFANWLAASFINDESLNPKFGYSREEIRGANATPQRVSIVVGETPVVFDYSVKPWQPHGQKVYIDNALVPGRAVQLSASGPLEYFVVDNLGRSGFIRGDFKIPHQFGLEYFFIFPINATKLEGFGTAEAEASGSVSMSFVEAGLNDIFGSELENGALIKRPNESEIYVIEGKYKRYLRPEIIALYGHLDAADAIPVNDEIFNSYATSNYVKYFDGEEVYAVWPDGTKHWLNITPQQWDASGRDWNAIFIINDLELNAYENGTQITR